MPFCIDESQQYLTPKEARVLLEVASGKTRKEIARLLFRAEPTIKSHTKHIAEKLGSKNAANMVMVALEKGVIRLLPCFLIVVVFSGLFNPERSFQRSMRRGVSTVRVAMRRPTERLGSAFG